MNLVERWFAELTTRQLRRSSHRSTLALEHDIDLVAMTSPDNNLESVFKYLVG